MAFIASTSKIKKKHRIGPNWLLKLFVRVEDIQVFHLKKELGLSDLIRIGNSILKKNKTLNAYSS